MKRALSTMTKFYGGVFLKKFKIISYIILLIVLVVLALTVYTSATQNNEQDEKEKVTSEIRYLDTKLVELLNHMNNIETRNYQIYTTKIEESRSAENSGGGSSGGNSSSDSSNTSSSSDSTSTQENSDQVDTENIGKNYEMKAAGILTTNRDIDWTSCKNESELIYTSISTITLDLYRLNVSQEDILNFNKDLDSLTVSLEEENKQLTLDNLIKVYEYIPKFGQTIVDDTLYKTVLETKLNVFRGYAKLDSGDWAGISTNMTDAINVYSTLLTNTEIDANKQTTINKGYVMLNELKNAVDTQNTSVFLIKYKNLLEEINNL